MRVNTIENYIILCYNLPKITNNYFKNNFIEQDYMKMKKTVFICFAAEDRYDIAEPIVYHLKNYGIEVWYDRQSLLLGDNRKQKNLIEGASQCNYAILILSKNTLDSTCAMEEIGIIKERYITENLIVFPVLYELSPEDIPCEIQWVKELIFKEINRVSGTRQICNHSACKITGDILCKLKYLNFKAIINIEIDGIPNQINFLLNAYQQIDAQNLNARIALLYATYLVITALQLKCNNYNYKLVSKICERLFSETRLNLNIDYREVWLLENSISILINEVYPIKNLK